MKNLNESLKSLDEHYLETLKYISRNFEINLEMLRTKRFSSTLYGESKTIEDLINAFEVKIKEDAIVTIARFQPAAKNLRRLVMLINSVRVLERMGDLLKANLSLIKDVEKKSPHLIEATYSIVLPVASKIQSLFQMYIGAFINKDINLLYDIISLEEEIDEIVDENNEFFLSKMKESPDNILGGSILMLLDKKFERLSDHIIHLVTDLIYILNGENLRKVELESTKK
ncbi:PhoU domain-containing protein [uncultured Cetobacterium sp.]|uniref:phosphate signaling complex PhoU family protein n=1 Tax=uncultured Cetobacterium sp. TaxID=527638 RepID=UPI0026398D0E|nr:PhoU domain-containing protein [uncultured Cetobacterium sp.]